MNFLDNKNKEWYVIITRPRWEKKVGANLTDLGVENLVPLQKQLRQWSDRKKWVEVPVFMTYAFVRCTAKERMKVYEAEGISRFLSIGGVLSKVSEAEIDRINRLLDYGKKIELEKLSANIFSKGEEVEVISGNLRGLRGIVSEKPKNGKKKIKILIESLNCFACTEISTEMLTAVLPNRLMVG